MQARIIETFCEGKFCDARNEDRVFAGERHIAVVDGSSAAQPIAGRPGGIAAAEVIVDVLASLPSGATVDTFERSAQRALADLARAHAVASPYAATVVLSLERGEIWRIGDCPFAVDGVWNIPEHNPHERAFFNFRRMMVSGYARAHGDRPASPGVSANNLEAITRDWLAMTKHWVNADSDAFGFAALDERPAPDRFKEVFPLPRDARTIILASDGAVVSRQGQSGPRDVSAMLEEIEAVRIADPLCLDVFPYWRRFLDGARFLDDTSFIAVELVV
ncbi:hypothetical protein KKP04_01130 [Rhodomicrobium sp. Az07]|uniref:hypothetical protein n=1 Tax=Rhodomicrobium sp. Az07 TaxID=2839034 RepID=UPI001BE6CA66|nr:hypothetical protein [Rhodomicrobium sp. Az07]MBT3069473.1 hypothetical protein [Rhodomicrobium sp. Az07]